jgi:Cd2+/Zn2+-exporting ATPase/Cu+-exporting ATPase
LAAASRLGILIKNTKFLESLSDADTVVLDKTGTVTLGRLEVTGVESFTGADRRQMLAAAQLCAQASRHPVSRAVAQAATAEGIAPEGIASDEQSAQVRETAGEGIEAVQGTARWLLGRRSWLVARGLGVPAGPVHDGPVHDGPVHDGPVHDGPVHDGPVHDGPVHDGPVVFLGKLDESPAASGGETLGCFLLADRVRPEARAALAELRGLGLQRSVLLTGDRRSVAERIGGDLAVDEVVAEVLPEEKLNVIRAERAAGHVVMMVGDGVNDALALARSDVGLALGAAASDVALRSADVAILADDLGRIPLAVRLARRTRTTIHVNVLLGAGASIIFVGLASAGMVAPLLGALLHNVGAALVLFNSARLLSFGDATKFRKGPRP